VYGFVLHHESKGVAKSFRINEDALEALREEARSQTLSLNTFVNQLLVNYTNFGRYLVRMHAMMLSRQTLSELVAPLSEDYIIKAGQNAGKTAPEELMTAKYGKITVGHVIDLMHNLSSYANWFEYTEKNEGEHWTITLMHELGQKWSLFIAHYFAAAFAATGHQAKYDVADRYVTFTI
jgi:hypothetical protein